MIEVTQAEAYREACTALGESHVAQRLMQSHVDRLETENAQLRAALADTNGHIEPADA